MSAHQPADVDELVGDHTEPDPSPHSVVAFVSAAIEAVSRLTTRPSLPVRHFWPLRNQHFLLLAFAFEALGRTIGNAHAFDAQRLRRCLVRARIECGVGRHRRRSRASLCSVGGDGRDQQVQIIGSLSIDLTVDNDLILCLLQLRDLAEPVGRQGIPKRQRRAAMKDEVVAELDLREEQPMLAARCMRFASK